MDETPLSFDMPGNRTIDVKGTSTVTIKTTGAEKSNFTVVLACTADGGKLRPMLIFKRKTMPKEKFPPGVIIAVHPKGWMDETLVLRWLKDVWMARPGGARGCQSLLVWDMFRAHLCEGVKKKLKETKTRQAVIPGGCTSLLQPLDVSLNKPFKTHVRKSWAEWMMNGDHTFTKGNAMRRAPLATVATWVKESWDAIPSDMVKKSFLKCGISNSMDGSEDEELYADFLHGTHSKQAEHEEGDDTQTALDDYYDDQTDTQAWETLAGEDSDTEFDGFTQADLLRD